MIRYENYNTTMKIYSPTEEDEKKNVVNMVFGEKCKNKNTFLIYPFT